MQVEEKLRNRRQELLNVPCATEMAFGTIVMEKDFAMDADAESAGEQEAAIPAAAAEYFM